jgi:trigger factor
VARLCTVLRALSSLYSLSEGISLSTTETKHEHEHHDHTHEHEVVPNPCERQISVEIPADVVAKQQQTILANYMKYARIPGFRKGKVPSTLVKQKFNDDIQKDLIEQLIPKYFQEEAKKQNLAPISQPQVTHLELNDGQPLKFTATFEVLPEIDISGYKDIPVEHEETSVKDEEVEAALKNLQEQNSTYTNVDEERAIADGDYAQVAFKTEGQTDEAPVEMDDVLVAIGGDNTIKEFTENLRGAKAGEDREFDVVYPADFGDQRLAGKTMHYKVHVKGIKNKQLPDLNDDFAKQMGEEFTTLGELKTKIREGMEHEKAHQSEHKVKDKLVDELVKKYDIAVPTALVEHQIDQRLDRGLRALAAQGLKAEQLKKMDMGRLREGQREAAEREVKASLLLEKIADAENIQVTDDEVDKEVQALAVQMQQAPEAIRARLEQNGALDRIKDRMRTDKALDMLVKK